MSQTSGSLQHIAPLTPFLWHPQESSLKDHMGSMMLRFLGIAPGSMPHAVLMLWVLTVAIALANYVALSLRMRLFTTEL